MKSTLNSMMTTPFGKLKMSYPLTKLKMLGFPSALARYLVGSQKVKHSKRLLLFLSDTELRSTVPRTILPAKTTTSERLGGAQGLPRGTSTLDPLTTSSIPELYARQGNTTGNGTGGGFKTQTEDSTSNDFFTALLVASAVLGLLFIFSLVLWGIKKNRKTQAAKLARAKRVRISLNGESLTSAILEVEELRNENDNFKRTQRELLDTVVESAALLSSELEGLPEDDPSRFKREHCVNRSLRVAHLVQSGLAPEDRRGQLARLGCSSLQARPLATVGRSQSGLVPPPMEEMTPLSTFRRYGAVRCGLGLPSYYTTASLEAPTFPVLPGGPTPNGVIVGDSSQTSLDTSMTSVDLSGENGAVRFARVTEKSARGVAACSGIDAFHK